MQRAEMERIRRMVALDRLYSQLTAEKPSRRSASISYLKEFPQNRNKTNVHVNNIVGNSKPGRVWYSRHALERNGLNSLTKNEMNAVIRYGSYSPSRGPYFNTKYQQWTSNKGTIAPLSNSNTCPKRRISRNGRTVVLSFCYPRAFIKGMYRPEVVTAYKSK